jgi:hypothetical protein
VSPTRIHASGRGWQAWPARPGRRLPAAATLIVALAAVPGCAAAGDSTSGEDPPPGQVRAQAEPVWREFAECVRARGYPDLPDPVVADDGTARIPGEAARVAKERHADALSACQPILRRLPAGANAAIAGRHGLEPPTSEQLTQLRRFAGCMRQHGVPEWPDPTGDGTFPLSDALSREGKSPRVIAARESCDELSPDAGRRIKVATLGGGGKP